MPQMAWFTVVLLYLSWTLLNPQVRWRLPGKPTWWWPGVLGSDRQQTD